jgi:HemK-like putative methylase
VASSNRVAEAPFASNRSIGEQLRLDGAALAQALGLSVTDARREVQILLCRALGVEPAWLLAHPESALEEAAQVRYGSMLKRRLAQEPVAYILGEREFYGLAFEVTPAVLIPRPETELLVELALARVPTAAPWRILDLGTGSGCIAVTLGKLLPHSRVVATDLSEAALAVTARNAQRHRVANLDRHQIFTELNRTGVVLSHKGEGCSRFHVEMREDGELWFHPFEDSSGFGAVGMVIGNRQDLATSHA